MEIDIEQSPAASKPKQEMSSYGYQKGIFNYANELYEYNHNSGCNVVESYICNAAELGPDSRLRSL